MWQHVQNFFGVGEDWVRPLPERWLRTDLIVAVASFVIGTSLLLSLSGTQIAPLDEPLWQQLLYTSVPSVAMVFRRRFPISAGLVAVAVIFLGSFWMPELTSMFTVQTLSFFLIYTAVAWARDRTHAMGFVAIIVLCLALWMAWLVAMTSGTAQIAETFDLGEGEELSFGRLMSWTYYNFAINIIFFAGATVLAGIAWWGARRQAKLREYSELLAAHAQSQTRQAVTNERLRIARELHDVVAHHVSAIGVHAGAARRVMERSDSAASQETVASTLTQVESSSRQAVTEMRSLLGALRDTSEVEIDHAPLQDFSDDVGEAGPADAAGAADADRSPGAGPGLGGLEELAASFEHDRPHVDLDIVEDPDIPRSAVPPAVSASLFRIAQESLSNVRAHSTASVARLTLRTGRARMEGTAEVPFAEVEVVDDGRPRHGTGGTGMGQLGMRERARSLGGVVEIGPRALGGYRVRVRLPLVRKES